MRTNKGHDFKVEGCFLPRQWPLKRRLNFTILFENTFISLAQGWIMAKIALLVIPNSRKVFPFKLKTFLSLVTLWISLPSYFKNLPSKETNACPFIRPFIKRNTTFGPLSRWKRAKSDTRSSSEVLGFKFFKYNVYKKQTHISCYILKMQLTYACNLIGWLNSTLTIDYLQTRCNYVTMTSAYLIISRGFRWSRPVDFVCGLIFSMQDIKSYGNRYCSERNKPYVCKV